jgi:TDG/mug DNA glycosylase family protein
MWTLPDLLRARLDIVFVGINPSTFSVEQGHYFARSTNRFWSCFSRSILSGAAKHALSVEKLGPEHDHALLDYGIGFTDLVKLATPRASDLTRSELEAGVQHLLAKLDQYQPRIVCFHGVTAYRDVRRALTGTVTEASLGLQELCMGPTRVYVVPNPSGANAHFAPNDQTRWYDRLAECLATLTAVSEQR